MLLLHLFFFSPEKSFDITYVNLRFQSPRPESFAIYKRTTEDGPWIPFQFYSASCDKTYNLPRRGQILREDQAICTNEFSDISPLTGGTVAFSTLEGRPNMFDFLHSPKLQVSCSFCFVCYTECRDICYKSLPPLICVCVCVDTVQFVKECYGKCFC